MTEVKYASEVIFTKDTPNLALTDELWGVFSEDLGESWPSYNGTANVGHQDYGGIDHVIQEYYCF